jgi:hypothetical protein
MRNIAFRLFTGLFSFALVLSSAGCLSQAQAPIPDAPQPIIPDNWKVIELDYFSFYAPPDMKDQKAQGIDSQVWSFRNSSMTFEIDFGRYSNDLEGYKKQPEYQANWVRINGRKAKLVTLRWSDEEIDGETEKDRKYSAAVFFPAKIEGGSKLTFYVDCVDPAAQEAAKNILLSIKFKQ